MASSTTTNPTSLGQALALGAKITGMDTSEAAMSRMALETKKAYDTEFSGNWTLAYELHDAAAKVWQAHADTARRENPIEQIYRIFSKQRVELHKERMAYLEPFAKNGKPVPSPVAMHPVFGLTAAGFTELVTLDKIKGVGVEDFKQTLPLSLQEVAHPRLLDSSLPQYTPTLPDIPALEYRMERTIKMSKDAKRNYCTVKLINPTINCTLLVLNTWAGTTSSLPKIQDANVSRPGDYPSPSFRIVCLASTGCAVPVAIPFATLINGLPTLKDVPIVENPDRIGKKWGPRRFAYGGRLFVRKPLDINGSQTYHGDAVYEYTKAAAKEGSKTGKVEDDAMDKKLFWIEHKQWTNHHNFKVFVAAGLDPLFREYLCAVQMMFLAVNRLGATSTENASKTVATSENGAHIKAALGATGLLLSAVLTIAGV